MGRVGMSFALPWMTGWDNDQLIYQSRVLNFSNQMKMAKMDWIKRSTEDCAALNLYQV
jgi:hypothetical protein